MSELRQHLISDTYVAYQYAYKTYRKVASTTFILFGIGISHRASIVKIITLFFEQFSALLIVKFVSILWNVVNAGCFGVGRSACSLLIIKTTSSMVGRLVGLCWTQRKPMLMNLNIIELEEGYPMVGSINSKLRSFSTTAKPSIISYKCKFY
jgi:hypothetical protein